MITQRAKHGFDQMVRQSLAIALGTHGKTVQVELLGSPAEIIESSVVMLSIASFTFRLMLFVFFEADAATRTHVAAMQGLEDQAFSNQTSNDAIAERGNVICGTFNRELCRVFAHVGMSTPHLLDRRCVDHLSLLRFGHLSHFRAAAEGESPCHVALCVCDNGDIDFEPPPEAVQESAGELELF